MDREEIGWEMTLGPQSGTVELLSEDIADIALGRCCYRETLLLGKAENF